MGRSFPILPAGIMLEVFSPVAESPSIWRVPKDSIFGAGVGSVGAGCSVMKVGDEEGTDRRYPSLKMMKLGDPFPAGSSVDTVPAMGSKTVVAICGSELSRRGREERARMLCSRRTRPAESR